jgi:hypothetical protein
MKKIAVILMGLLAMPAVYAGPFMKPGLWEVHLGKQVMDGKDMAPQMAAAQSMLQEQMAKMSPAQRKQMEQMMGGQAIPGSGGQRICISPEMAAQDKPMMPPEAKCEPSKFERSGNTLTFELNCNADGRTIAGRGTSVTSGDLVTSSMDMTTTDARGRHTMQSESQMKYLGADCQGVKPVEQLMKSMQVRPKQ